MKKFTSIIALLVATATLPFIVPASAQETLASWPFYAEVNLRSAAAGSYQVIVPLQVLDKSRNDLADLRLYDAKGVEIPYALRIRREVNDQQEVGGRLFNQTFVGVTATEVSIDLGESPGEHNEVEIETAGTNFRRRVQIEGGDSAQEWKTLQASAVILDFQSQNQTVQSNRVSYPASRFRYLRLRVFSDEQVDKQAPVITSARVSMTLREQGELTSWNVSVPPYQLLRNQGAPASAWTIDLGGRVPCDRLTISIDTESFSRSFQLDAIDDPDNIRLLASGELTRRAGEERKPLVITFDHEEQARKLRLLVSDYSNAPLPISSIVASAPVRELVFQLKEPANQPLRLYFGNPTAVAPHYDFEKDLSRLATDPVRSEVGAALNNPYYKPEPLPLTERIPWLIYVVLTASSLALALILVSLARSALRGKTQNADADKVRPGAG